MTKSRFIFMLLALITVTNCGKAKDELSYGMDLKKEISEIYNVTDIDIKMINDNTNNNDLKITFTNSRFNNYTPKKKEKIAKQIGVLANELRHNLKKIQSGKLIFIDNTNYGIIKKNTSKSYSIY